MARLRFNIYEQRMLAAPYMCDWWLSIMILANASKKRGRTLSVMCQ